MRRCTKKLIKRISELTNAVFKQSVIEVMDAKDLSEDALLELMFHIRKSSILHEAGSEHQDYATLIEKKQLIDELYLTKIIALPTKDLVDILFLHEHNRPSRAQRTLEAITSELVRRSILDDSSQSDAIYPNGDIDVKRKSKAIGKKATSKKCKTTKNK